MARERWFYAEGHRRMGPVARRELVEALLQLTDPRTCLVWRRGLDAWTPAAELPEIERLLAPIAYSDPRAQPAAAAPVTVEPARPVATAPSRRGTSARTATTTRSQAPLFIGAAVAVVVVAGLAWTFWPRTPAPLVPPPDSSATPGTAGAAASPSPAAVAAGPGATAASQGFSGWADQESDLPPAELRKLRGVGGWAGDTLTITLYNGSSWRVTEIYVLTSRLEGDNFVDAVAPQRLLPVGGAPVDGAVRDLLEKVAPDRKRAGVNPADTGPFEIALGPQPAAYRWKIERARGYPPR